MRRLSSGGLTKNRKNPRVVNQWRTRLSDLDSCSGRRTNLQSALAAIGWTIAAAAATVHNPWGEASEFSSAVTVAPPTAVLGRRVFYNHSKFDGSDGQVNVSDDAAIATDKT